MMRKMMLLSLFAAASLVATAGDVSPEVLRDFGAAKWLWPQKLGCVTNTTVEFRQCFVADRPGPRQLAIAADTVYAVFLNGDFVYAGRFPDVPPQRYYDVLSLEGVRAGTNVLSVSVYVQGIDSFQTIPGDPGVMFALSDDGKPVVSGMETGWRLSTLDRREGVARLSPQLAFSFEHDAAADEAAWQPIVAADCPRSATDFALERRPAARVEILPEVSAKIVGQGRLDASPVPMDVAPGMDATKMAPVSSAEFYKADGKSVRPDFYKDGFYFLVDLGREEAGFLSLDVDTDAGAVIDIGHAEHAEDGRIRSFIGGRNFAGRYRAKGGRQTYLRWERRMAGRYLQLHVRGVRTHFTLHRASVCPTELPVVERSVPHGLSPRQQRIWETAVRTLRLCMHEHYEDCPWREQALYANDARNQMLCGYYAFDDGNRMPELALQVHARGIGKDGWLELCMPARIAITIPSFTFCWVLSVADNLEHRKDAAFTRKLMPTVRAILDRRLAEMRDGLLPCPVGRRYWHFYEWADGLQGDLSGRTAVRPGEWRYDSPLNLFFVLALEAGARCAEATGDGESAQRWRTVAATVRETVRSRFWNAAAGQVETRLGTPGKGAELVQSLALLADAVPSEARMRVVRQLMNRSDWTEITLSQTLYKYEALMAAGGEAAASVMPAMDAEWGQMLDAGATSFWEMREGWKAFGNAGSLCHGWSAVPVYIYAKYGRTGALDIVRNGTCDWKIVYGSGARDKLAATDFQEIFEKATGARLEVRSKSEEVRSAEGKVFLVGAEFAERELADEQTWVTAKGGNIVLAGGGVAGSCYAVYDFCEKYFGYRLYGKETGDEVVKKVTNLAWDGQDISTKPAFTGYRISHNIPKARNEAEARFFRRNRNNAGDKPLCNRVMGAQHGVHLWIPSRAGQTWLDNQIGETWEPMFEKHPEYFTMHSDGKRIPDGQLCFTNRGLRDLFIRRFRAYAAKMGPGIYTVGPYDSYNGRFCWCPECSKLVERHKTNGAPLWDFVLELCEAVKDMEGVYVLSFAYKGPEQSEVAPVGIAFPENFVCDAAFLNDRPPTMMPERKMPDGFVYNRVESLKNWRSITKHLAWWYYGGSSPMQTYRRMQMELKELRDFGVDSVGSDGTGGEMEFADIGDYLYFQLLRNPDMDADAAARDIFRHKYGAAAETVFAYLRELEEYALDGFKKPGFGVGCMDTYESLTVEGKDLVRWQGYFDKAARAVKDDPLRLRNVEIARVGLDAWTVVFASRVRAAEPSYPLDVPAVLARGLKACAAAEKIGMVRKDRNPARRVLESMKYYSALKSEALPPELAAYDPKDVRLYLPEDPLPCFAKNAPLRADPLAAAGVAMVGELPGNQGRAGGVDVKLYDAQTKDWLKVKPIPGSAFKDGEYVLVNCGTARLPRRGMLVLGDRWGTSLDMRNLGRYYDPTYHHRQYEYWVSVRLDGKDLLCDRVYLVDKGMP